MPTTIAFTFPLGRYHGTPWHRAVNEGEIDWPPSPWRILRALIATWRTRWPELPEDAFDEVLQGLSGPPRYRTPPADHGHSRHYMPDPQHRTGATSTDLVLDPFLSLGGDRTVLVRWETDLGDGARQTAARLCELMPYLGRSESIVVARLLDVDPEPDPGWWAIDESVVGAQPLLVPTADARRSDLEVTTAQVRRQRMLSPARTVVRPYARTAPVPERPEPEVVSRTIGAIRWQLQSRGPFRSEFGILATDRLRMTRLRAAQRVRDALPPQLTGKQDNGSAPGAARRADHDHAHWLWLPADGLVDEVVLWMPGADLDPELAGAMLGSPQLDPAEPTRTTDAEPYLPHGYKRSAAYVVALGDTADVLKDIAAPAVGWRSVTPYLPVRHRKRRQTVADWVEDDVRHECRYRALPEPVSVQIGPDESGSARRHRRYRWGEKLGQARPQAVWLSLRFEGEVAGPLCLGALSHFGFGLLTPTGL